MVVGARELMGNDRLWIVAGVAGTALGPVAGGLLTEAISWQSIFIFQVPLILLAFPAARVGCADRPSLGSGRGWRRTWRWRC